MKRALAITLAVLTVVGMLAAVPSAALAQETTETGTTTTTDGATTTTTDGETETNETDGNETEDNGTIAPGARLGGIVGMQKAELSSEVEGRAFGLAVAAAASENAKVKVIAEQYGDLDARLANLTERKQELKRAHENGSMSTSRFRAEMAELSARTEAIRELANKTQNATKGIPEEQLQQQGINVTAIKRLKQNADELTGPQVAKIARSIGANVPERAGPPEGAGPKGNVTQGPPEDAGPRTTQGGAGQAGNATQGGGAGTTAQAGGSTTTQSGGAGSSTPSGGSGNATQSGNGGNGGSGNAGNGGDNY